MERLKLKRKNLSELGNDLFKITQCSSSKAITSLSLLAEGNKKLKHALAKNDRNELLVAHEIFKNAEGLTKEVADLSKKSTVLNEKVLKKHDSLITSFFKK